jgi:methylmalonyl-CoA mutase N-terminal domain/subunit
VQSGFVQRMIGRSALEFQQRVDAGRQIVVGVNAYRSEDDAGERPPALERPAAETLDRYLADLRAFRARRSQDAVDRALDQLARAFDDPAENTYGAVVHAIDVGATHGEVCARARSAAGFGEPLVVV